MNTPFCLRAQSQLKSAVRAPPMCRYPVGEGANRTRTVMAAREITGSVVLCTSPDPLFNGGDIASIERRLVLRHAVAVARVERIAQFQDEEAVTHIPRRD